jgi:hypothetical protein
MTADRRDSIAVHADRCDSCANRIADLAQVVHNATREREEKPATAFSASRVSTPDLIRRARDMERADAAKANIVGRASPPVTPRSWPGFAWNMRIAWAGIALAMLAVAAILVYNRSGPRNVARQSPPTTVPQRVVPAPRPTENEAANISPKHSLGRQPSEVRIANRPKRMHRHGRRLPESPSDVDIEKIRVQPSGTDLEKEGLPMPHGPQRHNGGGNNSP